MVETQNIEFKQRWCDDFLAELCGFANAQGGTLVTIPRNNPDAQSVSTEKILSEITANPRITIEELSSRLEMSTIGIEKAIRLLRKKGILQRVGGRKQGHWEVENIISQNKE